MSGLTITEPDELFWSAVANRDASFDFRIWYGVSTTGIYCMPSCASRTPLQKNVQFFDSGEQAEAAGYRACKRCRPNASQGTAAIEFAVERSSLGHVLVAASKLGVCCALLGDSHTELVADIATRFPRVTLSEVERSGLSAFESVLAVIENRFPIFVGALDLRGTPFQKQVWAELQKIPFGKTVTYTQLAERVAFPRAVRAVAQACGANPIAVLIPCHRIVRSDGSLSGYRWEWNASENFSAANHAHRVCRSSKTDSC